jgi:hypothetical protein
MTAFHDLHAAELVEYNDLLRAFEQTVKEAAAAKAALQATADERDTYKGAAAAIPGLYEQIARLQAQIDDDTPPVEPEPEPEPPSSRKPKIPTGAAYFGSTLFRRAGETIAASLVRTKADMGREITVPHYFLTNATLPYEITADVAAGRVPHISVKFGSFTTAATGASSAAMHTFAKAIKALNGGVIVGYHHEPTNDGGNAADYVKAWKLFRSIMDDEGVDNALYVWVMIGNDLRPGFNADAWFPGKDVVDIVGTDVYNWAPVRDNNWQPFKTVVANSVAYAKKVGLPLIVAETGTNEDPAQPGRKAQWFTDMFAYIETEPTIIGLEYFNNVHTNSSGGKSFTNDWQVTTSTAARDAFRKGAARPYFAFTGR